MIFSLAASAILCEQNVRQNRRSVMIILCIFPSFLWKIINLPIGMSTMGLIDFSETELSLPQPDRHNQVFIALQCAKTKQPFLLRYQWTTSGYVPVRSHRVDNDYFDGESKTDSGTQLSSEQLLGTLPCPYCDNEASCVCECGTLFCFKANSQEPIICPSFVLLRFIKCATL